MGKMELKITEAHEELQKVLAGLKEEDLTVPMAEGKWPIRDLLAHLIYWNQFCLDYVRERLGGGNPEGFPKDFDRLNKVAAEKWADHEPKALLEELDRIRRETLDYIEEIGPKALKTVWPYEGGESKVGEFINSFAAHQGYHCKQIQEWRKANNI